MTVADQLDSAVRSLQRLSGCMSVPTAYFRVHTDSSNLQSVGRTACPFPQHISESIPIRRTFNLWVGLYGKAPAQAAT